MQWFRARRLEAKDCAEEKGTCSVCSVNFTDLAGPVGFHCCALCYREQGERHAICSACSRDPSALDLYLSRRPSLAKTASAGSIGVGKSLQRVDPLSRSKTDF